MHLALDQEEEPEFLILDVDMQAIRSCDDPAPKALPGSFIDGNSSLQGNFVENLGNILVPCGLFFFGNGQAFAMDCAREQTVPALKSVMNPALQPNWRMSSISAFFGQ
jgi:hypothetical protein